MLLDDDALLHAMRSELRNLLGIHAAPAFHRIYRWPAGSPQYDVGHRERIAAIDASLPNGIVVTGSPYRGVGIPDIVRESTQIAQQLIEKHRAAHALIPGVETPG
jgi:oxygen-dependent protoporphyrinogen oxidase